MSILKFTDGVQLNTDGKLRTEHKRDGWYVLGKGMSIPVHSKEEGEALIKSLQSPI
jgi:hypothetical protein